MHVVLGLVLFCLEAGMEVVTFDVIQNETMDILTRTGKLQCHLVNSQVIYGMHGRVQT